MKIVPAPDFPTGGQIIGRSGSASLHRTGHGSVIQRARCHIETIASGGKTSTRTRSAIVVTELPYMVNKAGS